MKKFIVKHYYLLLFLIFCVNIILVVLSNNIIYKLFIAALFLLLFIFVWYIHNTVHKKIKSKFLSQQHYIEQTENRYLSDVELDKLYSKIYNEILN